jgi:uncharacterized protein YbaP (TraB family)
MLDRLKRLGLAAWLLGLAVGAQASHAAAPSCPPPLPTEASTVAGRDRGLLWRVTRDGRSSWLFGTLHVGKPAWRRFGPQVSAALRSSDVLALEIDPADPTLIETLTEGTPTVALPDALQARLLQAYARACVAAESMASLHPVLQATTLTLLEARWLGLDPGFALEQLLASQARGAGRRVVSLESAAQQKAALVPGDAEEALAVVDQSLAQIEDQSGRRVLGRLAQAWEKGDLAALENFEAWCECATTEAEKVFMRKLNDDRNPQLADGIEAQHRQGRRVFAAVGALHMTGPQALPVLLRERGFKVERVVFKR